MLTHSAKLHEVDRQLVPSTSIRSIGYDQSSSALEIEFHDSGAYRYFDVPEFLYQGLLLAKSKGSFFNRRLAGRYRFERLSDQDRPSR